MAMLNGELTLRGPRHPELPPRGFHRLQHTTRRMANPSSPFRLTSLRGTSSDT